MIKSVDKDIININNGTLPIGTVYNGTELIWKSLPITYTEDMVERASTSSLVMEAENCLYEKLKTLA